jgi:membrane-associated protein
MRAVMDLIAQLLHFVLHIDQVLPDLLARYGHGLYAILFLIVFCETGLVVTPLLPGDSLLFVAGTMAAAGGLELSLIVLLLIAAAVSGDTVNYNVGRFLGARLTTSPRAQRWVKPEYLARTHAFFERHGGKAIVLARFTPIVRTYAPFVAGLGAMRFPRFIAFCLGGATLWVGGITAAGYYFGGIPAVRERLSLVLLLIVILSVSPMLIAAWRARTGRGEA